jgi:hypothetical protein
VASQNAGEGPALCPAVERRNRRFTPHLLGNSFYLDDLIAIETPQERKTDARKTLYV